MTELSLNVLDIAQNSIKAKAAMVIVSIVRNTETKRLTISIEDNGCGMSAEQVQRVIDPFYTTRTTRKVGLGVPFFKMSAEMTGGTFHIESELGKGTVICAEYCYESIDMLPLGDMASTMTAMISVNPEIDFLYRFTRDEKAFTMDTREIKVLLEGMPVNSAEVLTFIRDFITENQHETDQP